MRWNWKGLQNNLETGIMSGIKMLPTATPVIIPLIKITLVKYLDEEFQDYCSYSCDCQIGIQLLFH